MTDPQHEETFADTERKLRDIITTLRAQLAQRETEMSKDFQSRPILPYDYARCMAQDCPLEETCMRKTPGRETYQSFFGPEPSEDCNYYISEDEWK